ncbi:MAG: enoyl-CoA hydratase/isomerase family protein [Myxococcales bacterium]|nr:enoyl-CoA hydratase/isomerase family protein [Myxococcales bacterium]
MTQATDATKSASEPCLLTHDEGRVRVLTFNRPRALNAFNQELYLALAEALRSADADPQVRVIVLTGAGDAFTAGQDLTEMASMASATGVIGFEVLLDALEAVGKPILAAVNGLGLGLGLTILLHTDINFMADEAKLKCPFVTLGVVPEAGSSFLLPHVLGYQRTAELLFSARYMGAKEARETGLVLETLPRAQLLPRVLELATKIAQQPPAAVRETKRLMRHATRGEARAARAREAEEFKARMVSPEFQEAMRAFAEKRAPNFD